ncbi:MAG: heme ABC exporter ATP-binding protein CcmA [Gemmatimonadota bacterium]
MPRYDGPLLSANGLTRAYGRLQVLRGLDLTLESGDALAVVGANGAGKTTLLRVLAGLMRPSAGEVRVEGRLLSAGDPDARRPLGLVSHHSLLYDDLSLLDNLMFAARLYGLRDPRRTSLAALETVGLGSRADESPRRLSRGMVQRAAIARALLHQPSVLLMDEPFTGLDSPAALQLRALLAAHAGAGRALVIVTHQLAEAWELASRIAVLVGGRWALEERRTGDVGAFLPRYHALTSA